MVIRPGRAPIRSSGGYIRAALRILRSLGTNAHVWLPGANGVSVASLPSNNYLLSDGSTGYSTVDGVVGLVLDAMGTVGAELVANGGFDTDTVWDKGASWSIAGGVAVCTGAANYLTQSFFQAADPVGTTYAVTVDVVAVSGTVYVGGGQYSYVPLALGTRTYYLTRSGLTNNIFLIGGGGGTCTLSSVSAKKITGIHLTQPTTANKPIVRRGAYNIATYSDAIAGGTGAWTLNTGATQTANNALSPSGTLTATRIVASGAGGNEGIYLSALSTVGRVEVFSLWLKGAVGGEQVMIGDASNRKTVTLTTSWARYSDNGATRVSNHSVIYAVSNTAMTFYASQAQLEAGTTAGDYTPTTAAAASNPSAGKYWRSFDGSNDSLLSGNLGITNACTIVIAGRLNNLATNQVLFAENTNGARIYVNTTGGIVFDNGTTGMAGAAAMIAAGVPFVITVRLSSGMAVIRLNGVQVATSATAVTFSAITGARIGTAFDGTSNPTGGALGWVVPIAAALSDADCLTVERFVAAQFPNGPVF